MPDNRIVLGSSSSLPDVWTCRLLRQLAQSPCHETFRTYDPSGDSLVRARRAVGLVLRRSNATGRAGTCREILAVVREARCRREEVEPWWIWTYTRSRSPRSRTLKSQRWPGSARAACCTTASTCGRQGIVHTNS